MTGRSDGQDDVDARFAEMIAELERDGFGGDDFGAATGKPSSDFGPNAQDHRVIEEPGGGQGEVPENAVWRGSAADWDRVLHEESYDTGRGAEDEHFVPPEPPPLPKPRAGTLVAFGLLVLGVLLLVLPSLIGMPARIGTPLALVCMASGLGMLILGMRSGPPRDDSDDGAQV